MCWLGGRMDSQKDGGWSSLVFNGRNGGDRSDKLQFQQVCVREEVQERTSSATVHTRPSPVALSVRSWIDLQLL